MVSIICSTTDMTVRRLDAACAMVAQARGTHLKASGSGGGDSGRQQLRAAARGRSGHVPSANPSSVLCSAAIAAVVFVSGEAWSSTPPRRWFRGGA